MMPIQGICIPKHTRLNRTAHIRLSDFYNALLSAQRSLGPSQPRRPKIGLAISGGVDSMALASLCSYIRLKQAKKKFKDSNSAWTTDFHFTSFIVDHKARDGSSDEAELVASRLHARRLNPTILNLHWPHGTDPKQTPDFETQARRLRYQALGAACRDRGIRLLLVAHHNDDQAENILMRLANGHKSIGLKGMQSVSEIPDCWGLHGVHESGTHEFELLRKSAQNAGNEAPNSLNGETEWQIGTEEGGVKVCRPLLQYGKSTLISTCLLYGNNWVEDETNLDTTKTPRNAVRYLFGNYDLPQALEKKSLLAMADRLNAKSIERNARAERFFRGFKILLFDARSGGLVVRLPKRALATRVIPIPYLRKKTLEARYKAALAIRRLIANVTPLASVSLQSLKVVVDSMFPDLEFSEAVKMDKELKPQSFTAQGVLFQRLESPSSAVQPADERIFLKYLDPDFIWVLTRQPYDSASAPHTHIIAPSSDSLKLDTPLSCNSVPAQLEWSPWQLWDGRYWIRVSNMTPNPLQLRSFKQEDIGPFRNALGVKGRERFDAILRAAAPGKVRWTLPVIAETTGRVLVLPSLQVVLADFKKVLKWEVRYKKTDLGPKRDEIMVN